jgi:Na+-driven multidrug efflux pump
MGVWFAMFADWIFRGSIFATRFVSGKWLTKYKPPQADG